MAGMTSDEAEKLQKEWGDKPCDYPDIIAQRDAVGRATDIWRCTLCGCEVDYNEWQRLRNKPPLDRQRCRK
jgi:hypothetical protein